jgi:hypothetical protein
MKELVSKDDLIKVIGKDNIFTRGLVSVAMKVLQLDKINKLYHPSADLNDQPFTEHMLKTYGVTYDDVTSELNVIPKEGPFIVVANHPFGGIEGVILFDAIAKIRPDFKMMTNFILSHVPNLKNVVIPVNPFTNNPEWGSSVGGIKAAMEHLAKGNGLGVFPAGEVSRYNGNDYPEDIEPRYKDLQIRIAVEMFAKRGAEGETSHSENGISRTYSSANISEDLLREITPKAGVI